jgi:hypothetical protein
VGDAGRAQGSCEAEGVWTTSRTGPLWKLTYRDVMCQLLVGLPTVIGLPPGSGQATRGASASSNPSTVPRSSHASGAARHRGRSGAHGEHGEHTGRTAAFHRDFGRT